jgi:HK97 gp10 family phage protein
MRTRPFHVEGLKELEQMLDKLSKSMAKTVLRNALKKAGQPIADAAKSMAPVGPTGNLRESITVSTKLKKSQRPGGYRDRTAVNVYVGNDYTKGPHAHLVEFGTGPRVLDKPRAATIGGNVVMITHTGQMPAKPFMRPAFEAAKKKALDIFVKEVAAQLLKAVARLKKRAATGKLGAAQMRALRR